MAFDERLAQRVRTSLGSRANITEKHMFGGLAFMLDGKMFCGILGEDLMVRVGPETYNQCLALPHVRPMDFTGKPMTGYVFVAPPGRRTGKALQRWIERGLEFAGSLNRAPDRKTGKPSAS
jgi:TfoX/Sxy family transcriptional regulator of competence genes